MTPTAEGIRRIVAAPEFGSQWNQILDSFNALSWEKLRSELVRIGVTDGTRKNREITRLMNLDHPLPNQFERAVEWIPVAVA